MKREYRRPALTPDDRIPLHAAAGLLKISLADAENLVREFNPAHRRSGQLVFIHPDTLQLCYLQKWSRMKGVTAS